MTQKGSALKGRRKLDRRGPVTRIASGCEPEQQTRVAEEWRATQSRKLRVSSQRRALSKKETRGGSLFSRSVSPFLKGGSVSLSLSLSRFLSPRRASCASQAADRQDGRVPGALRAQGRAQGELQVLQQTVRPLPLAPARATATFPRAFKRRRRKPLFSYRVAKKNTRGLARDSREVWGKNTRVRGCACPWWTCAWRARLRI